MASLSAETNRFLAAGIGNEGAAKEILTILSGTDNGNRTIPGTLQVTGALTATGGVVHSITKQVGGSQVKAGTTAGWTVGAANNLGTIATVAAGQAAGTLVMRLAGLEVGSTITGFTVYSSINSAGNAVTLDANLRKITIAAGATGTDASVASINQVSVTAATASSAAKTGLSEVVAAGVDYYILFTCTTGASTTLELTGVEISITTSS